MRQQGDHFIQRITQRERNALQQEFTGFQLREVEHVIDNGQQVIGRTFNGIEVVALGGVEFGFERQTSKTNHPVKRRTQLVRHVGEELRLDARGFLRALFRQIQFNVLDLHLLKRFA